MKKSKKYIPSGYYCYEEKDMNSVCLFWSLPCRGNGYCSYLKKEDWDLQGVKFVYGLNTSLLWDQVKDPDCPKYPTRDRR